MPSTKCRVLLADDHRIICEALQMLIDFQPDLKTVGVAANGKEVLALVGPLKPNVVVMDLTMPEMNGWQATKRLKAEHPEVKIVILTAHEDEDCLRQLCQMGASGFVLKGATGEDLIRAVRVVAQGGVSFEPGLAAKTLARQLQVEPEHSKALSGREKDVLVLLAWGYSNKEVAAQLNISVKTIETYKMRIGEKLGLRSRTDVVHYALQEGWLNESDSFSLSSSA